MSINNLTKNCLWCCLHFDDEKISPVENPFAL